MKKLKLFLITGIEAEVGYDMDRADVVCAEDETEALRISNVTVGIESIKEIGQANKNIKKGIIISDCNQG
jgi:hypothetical protein